MKKVYICPQTELVRLKLKGSVLDVGDIHRASIYAFEAGANEDSFEEEDMPSNAWNAWESQDEQEENK